MKPGDKHWYSAVEAPLTVTGPEAVEWNDEADVVVVGLGGAGVSAALDSLERGFSVVALDRQLGGGATEASGGVFYAGGGTSIQRAAGEEDTVEAMFRYLQLETQGVVSDATLRRFCEESVGHTDWLMQHGVKFHPTAYKRKTSYPGLDYFLYHSDNTLLPASRAVAKPAARGHRGDPGYRNRTAVNMGGAIFWPLRDAALRAGLKLHRKTEVRQLVVDAAGHVLGVKVLQLPEGSAGWQEHEQCLAKAKKLLTVYPFMLPGARYFQKKAFAWYGRAAKVESTQRVVRFVRAKRGVVLSAGGFVYNRAMLQHHCPKYAAGVPLGTAGDDGTGIRLGESAGGHTARMDRGTAWRFINPPEAWAHGLIVNRSGERIVNEMSYGATIGAAMCEEHGGKAWLVLDRKLVRQAWQQSIPWKVLQFQWQLSWLNQLFGLKKARNVVELAALIGCSSATLEATLAASAAAKRGEQPDAFGRDQEDIHDLEAPYYLMDISLDAKLLPCTVLTMGGLVVDEATGAVIREDGKAIGGLYAAGRTAVGVPSHLYMSGLSIADGVFSGRRAAKAIAES